MKHDIYIHNDINVINIERNSYFGGRTECFRIGEIDEKVYRLDVNSMYPKIMQDNRFPTKLIFYYPKTDNREKISKQLLDKYLYSKEFLIIAELEIESKVNNIPYRNKEENRLLFPTGNFKTTLCTPEIIQLIKSDGIIKKVHKIAVYESKPIFKDYIKHFYKQRLKYKNDKDKIFEYFTKIFMNSLYGKFGQRSKKWIRTPEYDYMYYFIDESFIEFVKKDGSFVKLKFIGNESFKEDGYLEFYDGFVAVSSFVTAYSRCLLWNLIKVCKNTFYVDTDSIFTNKEGYDNLINAGLVDSKELGKFKLEETGKLEIHGLKDYVFNGKIKIKGIRKGSKQINKNKFEVIRFTGFAESLRHFDIDNVYMMKVEKTLTREYKKGVVKENGFVEPFKFKVGD